MPKVSLHADGSTLRYYCPGCNRTHEVTLAPATNPNGANWTWNGDENAPTLSPSVNVEYRWGAAKNAYEEKCHHWITAGRIIYLSDCTHGMAGQTLMLPNFPDGNSLQ